MSEGKKACITGGIVALLALGLLLPLKGPSLYKHDLTWVPNKKDPTVLAAYIEEETEIEEVDQLYPLQVLVEEENYSAYFFHKAKDGTAVATWLVRIPTPEDTILTHQEKVVPRIGLRVTSVTVEDGVLRAVTKFDGGGIFGAILISVLTFLFVAGIAYGILEEW